MYTNCNLFSDMLNIQRSLPTETCCRIAAMAAMAAILPTFGSSNKP
jgi:hypothetical protein